VPYWTERFNVLARQSGIELEVIFLSSKSRYLPATTEESSWQFKYKKIRDESAISGYSRVNLRLPKPWSLVSGSFDLLIMPYGDPDFVFAAILCVVLRKRYCLFVPNNELEQRTSSWFRETVKRSIYRHSMGALVTGVSQRDYACNYISDRGVVHITGNPAPGLINLNDLLETRGRDSIREELGWDNKFVILYVGRLSQEKGLYTFIDSLQAMREQGLSVHAVFTGSGDCEQDLRKQVADKGLDIEFSGFLEGEALTKRYIAADVFILPSHSEAWGLVVNEAMEAGLPVVISDRVGAQKTLVRNGENGIIFNTGNAKSLTVAMTELFNSAKIRKAMSKKSLEIIQQHSISSWVDNVVENIHRLFENRPSV